MGGSATTRHLRKMERRERRAEDASGSRAFAIDANRLAKDEEARAQVDQLAADSLQELMERRLQASLNDRASERATALENEERAGAEVDANHRAKLVAREAQQESSARKQESVQSERRRLVLAHGRQRPIDGFTLTDVQTAGGLAVPKAKYACPVCLQRFGKKQLELCMEHTRACTHCTGTTSDDFALSTARRAAVALLHETRAQNLGRVAALPWAETSAGALCYPQPVHHPYPHQRWQPWQPLLHPLHPFGLSQPPFGCSQPPFGYSPVTPPPPLSSLCASTAYAPQPPRPPPTLPLPPPPPAAAAALSAASLVGLTLGEQREALGEVLFPLVLARVGDARCAGKVTGLLLQSADPGALLAMVQGLPPMLVLDEAVAAATRQLGVA